ncbi:MAG TPA: hypothetical protein VLJ21_01505, partial [Candidatus Binatia bacterium]|nr:hypothetical protein [Candidatus Binatia bacterium]
MRWWLLFMLVLVAAPTVAKPMILKVPLVLDITHNSSAVENVSNDTRESAYDIPVLNSTTPTAAVVYDTSTTSIKPIAIWLFL